MSATYHYITEEWTNLPHVMRVAVLAQLHPKAASVVSALDGKALTARQIMEEIKIRDDDVEAMAGLVVALLQLRSFGLVVRS